MTTNARSFRRAWCSECRRSPGTIYVNPETGKKTRQKKYCIDCFERLRRHSVSDKFRVPIPPKKLDEWDGEWDNLMRDIEDQEFL